MLPANTEMVLTRSQSAERERLLNKSNEPRSEGVTETTRSCLVNQEEEDQEPLPDSTHLDPDPENTSRQTSEQPLLYQEPMTEPGPFERELIRHERVDFETESFAGPALRASVCGRMSRS